LGLVDLGTTDFTVMLQSNHAQTRFSQTMHNESTAFSATSPAVTGTYSDASQQVNIR